MGKPDFTDETKRNVGKEIEGRTGLLIHDEIIRQEIRAKDLNAFIYGLGIIGPAIAIFQAVKIYMDQTAAGVSAIYWFAYLAIAVMWFGYGAYHKIKPIMAIYGAWIVIEVIIINGIFLYR
jgi:hypothetical protein